MRKKDVSDRVFNLLLILDRPNAFLFFSVGLITPILMLYFIASPDLLATLWGIFDSDIAAMLREGKDEMENVHPLDPGVGLDMMVFLAAPLTALFLAPLFVWITLQCMRFIAKRILKRGEF